jgi:hypothetical protein
MGNIHRSTLSFEAPGEDPRFAKISAIHLSKKIQDGYISIWPTGWKMYEDQLVLVSKDGKHTTILRGACYAELKKLLLNGYSVVNGKYRNTLD